MASFIFKNIYLNDYFTIVGPLEKNSHLKHYNMALKDYYDGEKTFEQAEIKMQKNSIKNILERNNLNENDIDLAVGGDLINQISITNYAVKNFDFPFLGNLTFEFFALLSILLIFLFKINVILVFNSVI